MYPILTWPDDPVDTPFVFYHNAPDITEISNFYSQYDHQYSMAAVVYSLVFATCVDVDVCQFAWQCVSYIVYSLRAAMVQ